MVEFVVFAVSAAIVLGGALGVVGFRSPVHNVLSLIATLFGVAVLFIAQEAYFLAAVQIIVYAGAIVVLFLFVIMLVGVDRLERLDADTLKGQQVAAAVVGGLGSIPGVIVGALVLVGLPELLREFAEYRLLVYGAVLVIMMLKRPEGLLPEARRKLELHEMDEA